ncbi:MAG: AAA family ATPase [Eubacteriales bacterium]|nr:AAA family ATPase [Eubacteriales bacterium]
MNIRQAKEEIKNTVKAYLRKDEQGNYRISAIHQRPVLLTGPPGIGKTAIVKQISQELEIGLVAYTMTHHTRQSAVGLPVVVKRQYQGQEYTVTEYTMSEIISSIYECMESSGCREGILFIDEINCVSETLGPTMLQFLQNKTFGMHKVPAGWIIVAAGNPREYNKSAREFDIVTLDRVRRMDVKEDYEVWKEYAYMHGIHPAILSWLNMHPDRFYHVESTAEEKLFVTARGWEDLSVLLCNYEEMGIENLDGVVSEYIQEPETARDFGGYYRLYKKYRQDYDILKILDGSMETDRRKKLAELAGRAAADERLAVAGMILDGWNMLFSQYREMNEKIQGLNKSLEEWKKAQENLEDWMRSKEKTMEIKRESGLISDDEKRREETIQHTLREYYQKIKEKRCSDPEEAADLFRRFLEAETEQSRICADKVQQALDHGFAFAEESFGDGIEVSLLTSDLLQNPSAAEFISRYGCERFFVHSDALLLERRRREILQEVENMDL